MDLVSFVVTIAATIGIGLLLWLFTRRLRNRGSFMLRPIASYTALEGQVGRAIESGSQMHVTLGRASLIGAASPTSVAALAVVDRLAQDGSASGTPPLVTVGEGTLLAVAKGSLRHAHSQTDSEVEPGTAQFIATDTDPFAYAGGVAAIVQQNKIISNVMVGHFGQELAIMAAAADRAGVDQVIGTDDPVALSLATAVTDNVLIGEELFAAGAYLEGKPSQIASLRVQDFLRWIINGTILALAGYQLYQWFAG